MLRTPRVRAAAGALVLAVAGLPFATRYIVRLYSDAAPFHQNYLDATPAQNKAVTTNLVASLVGVPLILSVLVALTVVALRGRALRALSAAVLVANAAALHAWYLRLALPYGFGSGYEHASAEQLAHISLARACGWGWAIVAVAGVWVFFAASKPTPTGVKTPPLRPQ